MQPKRHELSEKDAAALNAKRLKMREKDLKEVRGIFKFYELPNGFIEFAFKKYAEDKAKMYKLTDGQAYTLPLMVAKHLNTSGSYPDYSWGKDENGVAVTRIAGKTRRYGFQSLEFTDEAEIGSAEETKVVIVESL
jgi:hypothetical protein